MDPNQIAFAKVPHADRARQYHAAAEAVLGIDAGVAQHPQAAVGVNVKQLAGDPAVIQFMAEFSRRGLFLTPAGKSGSRLCRLAEWAAWP